MTAISEATAAQVANDLQHPDQVPLTERAEREHRAGRWTRMQRWWRSKGHEHDPRGRPGEHLHEAPLLMVAVDLKQHDSRLTAA